MNKLIKFFTAALFVIIAASACRKEISEKELLDERIFRFEETFSEGGFDFQIPPGSKIQNFNVDLTKNKITFYMNKQFTFRPFRPNDIDSIYSEIKKFFGDRYSNFNFQIIALDKPIKELVPNIYRNNVSEYDSTRLPRHDISERTPVVTNKDKPVKISKGLENKNIVIWNSHGWYYNNDQDRWMWQRPRLFQTVEDLVPTSFVLPYIVPMLENAGANVFIPRERDTQTNEIVIDNDQPDSLQRGIYYESSAWGKGNGNGFAIGNPPYPNNFNPFLSGTYKIAAASVSPTDTVKWIPNIPEEGFYSVYVSYNSSERNIPDAQYTVYHIGGKTKFSINQKIGGNTWIYLGKFKFEKGINEKSGKVELVNTSEFPGQKVTADAVRFGGGMGIIAKGGRSSNRPKFTEGSRYYLQYAGMPDTLVYSLNDNKSDYRDDYQSRGEYVNYLYGAPFGPNKDRTAKGLGIPIDISLAFHTDAGESRSDTTIGTLLIYSVEDADSQFVFPDTVSRFANRDFADILQTEIVNDIRAKYDTVWRRRQLMEAQYSEAFRPNVPAALLELLSHQNFLDMQFMLDPRFRFDVSRSIYKAMLKFLSVQYNFDFVVQPLPVDHFQTSFNSEGNIELKWKSVRDPLEPTAVPDHYIVYTRTGESDFDNGVPVYDSTFVFSNPEKDKIYSFKVTAVNEGGESFSSEILSVCKLDENPDPVLIVNGFDRISGPSIVDQGDFRGFLGFLENGVPDKYDLNFTGYQFNFNANSDWKTDDAPGHGASFGDMEATVIAGNSFDYPFVHGKAIKNAGYSFVSSSDESVMDEDIQLSKYIVVDLILGEEKETIWQKEYADSLNGTQFVVFPKNFQNRISEYLSGGGNLFVSGAYVGTDLFSMPIDSSDILFARKALKFDWITDHAVKTGSVYSIDSTFFEVRKKFNIVTELNDSLNAVESPDAIQAINGSKNIFRYGENRFSAATAYNNDYGVVVFGFPFEAVKEKNVRLDLMKSVLNYLLVNKKDSSGNH